MAIYASHPFCVLDKVYTLFEFSCYIDSYYGFLGTWQASSFHLRLARFGCEVTYLLHCSQSHIKRITYAWN